MFNQTYQSETVFLLMHGSFCSSFKIPEIYWQYSTKRVLTMEFCEGGKVDDLPYMKNHKISSDEASQNYLILACQKYIYLIRRFVV